MLSVVEVVALCACSTAIGFAIAIAYLHNPWERGFDKGWESARMQFSDYNRGFEAGAKAALSRVGKDTRNYMKNTRRYIGEE